MKINKYANFVKINFDCEKDFNDYVKTLEIIQEKYVKEDISNIVNIIKKNKMEANGEIITLIPNDYADTFCYLSYKLALILMS